MLINAQTRMPYKLIDMNMAFNRLSGSVKSITKKSHRVFKGILTGSSKTWVCKEMGGPEIAKLELLAQEFFRLINCYQPETRLGISLVHGTYFILSEEVIGLRELTELDADKFDQGVYRGLGQAMVIAMFLEEIDFKNGNVGLDFTGQVIKIDGDWCFSKFRKHNNQEHECKLTPEGIAALPYPDGFYAYQWLDFIYNGERYAESRLVSKTLGSSTRFREEVNQALLKTCLLPDCLIERFVEAYRDVDAARFIEFIKTRREELKIAAIQNPSFRTYLFSRSADALVANFKTQLNTFVVADEEVLLIGHLSTQVNSSLMKNLRGLRASLAEQLRSVYQLVDEVANHRIAPEDEVMDEYIAEIELRILRTKGDAQEVAKIHAELIAAREAVNSGEVQAVKEEVNLLRATVSWRTIGKRDKAARIEKAFCNIPILQRGKVISGDLNDVQKELATKRYLAPKTVFFSDAPDKIDATKSARAFIELKNRFADGEVARGLSRK